MDRVKLVFFLKPDAVIRRYVGARTLKTLLDEIDGLKFLTFMKLNPSKDFLAQQHYGEHQGKFFFDWLVDYTAVGPIYLIMIEAAPKKVAEIREVLGPTLVQKAAKEAPGTIRGRYGIYGGVNVAHASDSVESAKRESMIWENYLRETMGTDIYAVSPEEVLNKIIEYIEENLDYPIIDNKRYLELSEELSQHPEKRDEIKEKFIKLLSKETTKEFLEGTPSLVVKFAEILVRNALLRKP